ncbi:hypothetical protein GYMLUDRAFT_49286 [Collybiopsis luxurians FD-317 M1]|uniref:Unplaced genomic scaffold GYMLUscaffold_80, whole genome shotgun sequence n=1 Tax=Collybiopsis luxurians FD-317 M1 TaxID=944289 RepID=A0A0D0CEZ8_9AGAR|nr:hypothetical protein GYMLUDRAFT_49286 [Collybiopsis luxurians FD-317 M1]
MTNNDNKKALQSKLTALTSFNPTRLCFAMSAKYCPKLHVICTFVVSDQFAYVSYLRLGTTARTDLAAFTVDCHLLRRQYKRVDRLRGSGECRPGTGSYLSKRLSFPQTHPRPSSCCSLHRFIYILLAWHLQATNISLRSRRVQNGAGPSLRR